MDEDVGERVRQKCGLELFREVLRLLPGSAVEDYYKNGAWQDDVMRLDVQILSAHRIEAGAPDPPPLSEVRLPENPGVPKAVAMPMQLLQAPAVRPLGPLVGYVRPPGPMSTPPAPVVAPAPVPVGFVRPPGPTATPAVVAPAATPIAALPVAGTAPSAPSAVPAMFTQGAEPKAKSSVQAPPVGAGLVSSASVSVAIPPLGRASAAAELRQIADFVSKWGLDPALSKAILSNLAPARRRFVMQQFKPLSADATSGALALTDVAKLEEYIAQCERTNSWAAADAAAAALAAHMPSFGSSISTPPTLGGVAVLAGVKRGLDQALGATATSPIPAATKARTAVVVVPPGGPAWSPTAPIRPGVVRPVASPWAG